MTEWQTQRLVLRHLDPSWAQAVREYGLRCREYHQPWDPIRPRDWWALDVVRERMSRQLDESLNDSAYTFYLSPRSQPDRILGIVTLRNLVRGSMHGCHIGWGLEPDFAGQGLMSEAVREVTRVGFTRLALHRIEANIMPANERSLRVAERCGFEREGMCRRYLRIAGRWEDHIRLARINDDMP